MEIITHNKQITKGSILVAIQDAAFGVTIDDCLKVKSTTSTDKVEFEKPDGMLYLANYGSWRFRKAYKNEVKLCR